MKMTWIITTNSKMKTTSNMKITSIRAQTKPNLLNQTYQTKLLTRVYFSMCKEMKMGWIYRYKSWITQSEEKLSLVVYPNLSPMYIHMQLDQTFLCFHTLDKVSILIFRIFWMN